VKPTRPRSRTEHVKRANGAGRTRDDRSQAARERAWGELLALGERDGWNVRSTRGGGLAAEHDDGRKVYGSDACQLVAHLRSCGVLRKLEPKPERPEPRERAA
jgi:hypothetical protein